jgi:hypothetical protein
MACCVIAGVIYSFILAPFGIFKRKKGEEDEPAEEWRPTVKR